MLLSEKQAITLNTGYLPDFYWLHSGSILCSTKIWSNKKKCVWVSKCVWGAVASEHKTPEAQVKWKKRSFFIEEFVWRHEGVVGRLRGSCVFSMKADLKALGEFPVQAGSSRERLQQAERCHTYLESHPLLHTHNPFEGNLDYLKRY